MTDNIQYLMDNADAPIRYRVAREILKDEKLAKETEAELYKDPSVNLWLKNLKPETPQQYWSMEHGSFDFCLENALPKIVQLGLHSGLPPVIDAVQYYKEKMESVSDGEPYRGNGGFRLGFANMGFYSILTANFLSLAGIEDKRVRDYMLGGLDVLFDFVKKGNCDIYVSNEERMKLKAVPSIWKDRKFIKQGLGFCYPLIYDIVGLHKLYGLNDTETDRKINAVIEFISTDEFHHTVSDNYGILISGEKKYHAMGWDPKYPGWFGAADYMENVNAPKLLFFAQYISKYPVARKTKWFGDLLSYLDKYKTGSGTYLFPAGWMKEQRGYAVQGSHISFGENRKKKNWREIEATFYMRLLYQDII